MNRKIIIFIAVASLLLSALAAGCSTKENTPEDVTEVQQAEEIAKEPAEIEEPVAEEPAVKEEAVVTPIVTEPEKQEEEPISPEPQPEVQETPQEPIEEPSEEQPVEPEKNAGPSVQLVKNSGDTIAVSLAEMKDRSDLHFSGSFYWLNSFGSTGYTEFKGVKLWSLLDSMGIVNSSSTRVKVVATDGYSMEFDISAISRMDYIDETDQDVKLPIIIAWEENGVEYDPSEGAPFKLVVGQKEPGDVNKPQWVSNIEKIIVE